MTKIRGFSKGTRQYLTFVGSPRIHPAVRSESCTFLGTRFPRLVAINHLQTGEYRKAVAL